MCQLYMAASPILLRTLGFCHQAYFSFIKWIAKAHMTVLSQIIKKNVKFPFVVCQCLVKLFWVIKSAVLMVLLFLPCDISHLCGFFSFLSHSERLQTWQKCSADREWNPWSLPQIPGDLPQPANPARTWGAPQDLWWGLVVFFRVKRIHECCWVAFVNTAHD